MTNTDDKDVGDSLEDDSGDSRCVEHGTRHHVQTDAGASPG